MTTRARVAPPPPVTWRTDGPIAVVTIDRPATRNAVDAATAEALLQAFQRFDAEASLSVAVLTGAGGTFSSGADLKAIGAGQGNRVSPDGPGPLGPTRLALGKPVIAAVEGHAVAGGLELALWCDLRVAARDAVFGVFCRRWGVPLIDGGTVRLPRLIGHSRALDLILTGRAVGGEEALRIGLANRLAEHGGALPMALELARQIAQFPQTCLRADRQSSYDQWSMPLNDALKNETRGGIGALTSRQMVIGVEKFVKGEGRGGK